MLSRCCAVDIIHHSSSIFQHDPCKNIYISKNDIYKISSTIPLPCFDIASVTDILCFFMGGCSMPFLDDLVNSTPTLANVGLLKFKSRDAFHVKQRKKKIS